MIRFIFSNNKGLSINIEIVIYIASVIMHKAPMKNRILYGIRGSVAIIVMVSTMFIVAKNLPGELSRPRILEISTRIKQNKIRR